MLEPVVMGDLKYARSGELKRALSSPVGRNPEENSFRVAHLKKSPPASVEVIKRLRSSVSDLRVKASRPKRLDLNLNKLNKFCEAMPRKKKQQQQWNELLTNELTSGSTLKTGFQMHRNLLDPGSQISDDRPKSVVLNKRTRTSVAEALVERKNNGVLRQSLIVTKERDMLKDNNEDSDTTEELPAGGEGWDKTKKRKHFSGAVFFRSVDNDGEVKRNMHHKLTIESTIKANDLTHIFRSGASGGCKKLGSKPSPIDSVTPLTLKNEQEIYVLSRYISGGPTEELPLEKLNVKLNKCVDNHAMGSNPVVKEKASRAPQSGPIAAADSAANVPLLSETLESWEQAPVNKTSSFGGANNLKCAIPIVSCSPSIMQWGGQRPQKITRTRRTNIIPVSNYNEVHMQSVGCSPSEFGSPWISIVRINASPLSKSATSVKLENVPSPVRLSESEGFGAGEIRINDKGVVSRELEEKTVTAGQVVGASAIPIKKKKCMAKEETRDGVRRQGCTGTMLPFSRPNISTTWEKLDTMVPTKPFQTGSDKSGRYSKSGRPLKKLDCKGFSRGGYVANGGSPDCSGDSDDLEELQTAANLACSSSFNACSSPFWKTFDALFASVDSDEKSYLSEQIKLAEELCASLAQNCSNGSKLKLDDFRGKRMGTSDSISCQRNGSMESKNELKDPLGRMDNVEQLQFSCPSRCSDSDRKFDVVTPLYQRLLSAMIIEDETKENEGTGKVIPTSSVDDSFPIGSEIKLRGRFNFGEPVFGVQTQKNGNAHKIFSCNGSTDITGIPSAQAHVCIGELIQRDGGNVHPEVELLVGLSRCDYVPKSRRANNIVISSSDFEYEQMCLHEKLVIELESVGLFLEAVPALDDNEEEFFNEEFAQLEKGLHEQIGRKKTCLDKIYKSAQGENIARDPEQEAMDKLVEMAYKKLLATKGSFASKHGVSKVSKQVALAFSKRTLARCHKFEDSGASCFSEPAFRELVCAKPPRFAERELLSFVNLSVVNDGRTVDAFETSTYQSDMVNRENVPMSNRGKRKEFFLNDVSGGAGVSGGAKGKRSGRDRDMDVNTKAGQLCMNSSKGDRKTKAKLKQKTTQLSMSRNAFIIDTTNHINPSGSGSGDLLNNGGGNRLKDVMIMSAGNAPLVPSNETKESMDLAKLPFNDIDGIEELGVDSEIGAPQDINSWLSFDVDGLQDHDGIGLEIPNDDLSELNMF